MDKRTCRWCDTDISHRRPNATQCSKSCRDRHDPRRRSKSRSGGRTAKGVANCSWCDATFTVYHDSYGKFCTIQCVGASQRTKHREPIPWATCATCDGWFVSRGRSPSCPPCLMEAKAERAFRDLTISRVCWNCQRNIDHVHLLASYCSLACRRAVTCPRTPLRRVECSTCDKPFLTRKPTKKYCGPHCKPHDRGKWDDMTPTKRLTIYKRDGWRCHLCGTKTRRDVNPGHPQAPSLDHLIPRSAGGTDHPTNLATAHIRCNSLRRDTGPAQLKLVS